MQEIIKIDINKNTENQRNQVVWKDQKNRQNFSYTDKRNREERKKKKKEGKHKIIKSEMKMVTLLLNQQN